MNHEAEFFLKSSLKKFSIKQGRSSSLHCKAKFNQVLEKDKNSVESWKNFSDICRNF